jgi:hypothetical protein
VAFRFSAYGILAVAALLFVLYLVANKEGMPNVGQPLLYLGALIVVVFLIYMLIKLAK